jgi:hypothetical protein
MFRAAPHLAGPACLALVASGATSAVASPATGALRFRVSYSGSGVWRTVYHSEPPNPGGAHDTNDANDSSTQSWSLTFTAPLTVPACRPRLGRSDPCLAIRTITGATGRQLITGRVAHRHRDGLFPAQNGSVHCTIRGGAPAGLPLRPAIRFVYSPATATISLTALDPVREALTALPGQCPGQGDSLDGLNDEYFTPGFSFSPAYGPDRWFKSRTIALSTGRLHRSRRIRIRVAQTRAGTPPRSCLVPAPAYERCTTGGSWRGVVVLTAIR